MINRYPHERYGNCRIIYFVISINSNNQRQCMQSPLQAHTMLLNERRNRHNNGESQWAILLYLIWSHAPVRVHRKRRYTFHHHIASSDSIISAKTNRSSTRNSSRSQNWHGSPITKTTPNSRSNAWKDERTTIVVRFYQEVILSSFFSLRRSVDRSTIRYLSVIRILTTIIIVFQQSAFNNQALIVHSFN